MSIKEKYKVYLKGAKKEEPNVLYFKVFTS